MTIQEASLAIISYFKKNNIFNIKDCDKLFSLGEEIKNIDLTKELKEQIVITALEELESSNLVKKINTETAIKTHLNPENNYWVLKKPLGQIEQAVSLGGQTAVAIAEIINAACKTIGDENSKCNPLNIAERDIQILIHLATLGGIAHDKIMGENIGEQ